MEKFNKIISKFFKLASGEIKDDMTAKEIPEWDSMNYLLLIAELEKQYKISFGMQEVLDVKTLGDIKKMLLSKVAKL